MEFSFRSFLKNQLGLIIAIFIVSAWLCSTIFAFSIRVDFRNPWIYALILMQMHLYTGLFITAHDAMHGTVSQNKSTNHFMGWICTMAYACFFYSKLIHKHHDHHRYVHTEKDPDYNSGNFFIWYFKFFLQYFTWYQYVLLNGLFFFLNWVVHIPQPNLILFWIIPSLLSSLQLFYFGTYAPHHGDPGNNHQARSQRKNHLLAFFTCYFFGYHYEHHHAPYVPWWKLYTQKTT